MSDVSKLLRSLTKNEQCERIDMLLTKNERQSAFRSGHSPKMSKWANGWVFWANEQFAHFFAKNKRFAQKTDEQNSAKEQLWGNCEGQSLKISDCEGFAQVALQKWENEQIAQVAHQKWENE